MTAADFEAAYKKRGDPWRQRKRTTNNIRHLHVLESLEPVFRGKRILEVGCGLGGMTHVFSTAGLSVVGFDISPTAIAGAKTRYLPNTEFVVSSMSDYDGYGRHDIIMMIECLYYLDADEQSRVLSKIKEAGPGTLLLSAPTVGEHQSRKYYTEPELVGLLERHGFTIEQSHIVGMNSPAATPGRLASLAFKVIYRTPLGFALDAVWDHLPEAWIYQKLFVCRY